MLHQHQLSPNNLNSNPQLNHAQKSKHHKYFWLISSIQSYQTTLVLFLPVLDLKSQVFNYIGRISLLNLFFPVELVTDSSHFSSAYGFGSNTDNTIIINPLNQCLIPLVLVVALYISIFIFRKKPTTKSILSKIKIGVFYVYLLPNLLICLQIGRAHV